ncbi:MAG: adenylate/guanylate cyclase domain-containing protein [Cyanobacteria bacterium J06627_28]
MHTPSSNSGKIGHQIASKPMNIPAHPQIQRTLAAIVVTDAVGFSKRMSQDEDRALSIINRDLQLITELCDFFEGKILKTVGDGVLMYFVSAVQAAACAVEMQKMFIGFEQQGQGSDHFVHRVGVHLGDIFFNQQDMMGTGVNIAARLESAAKPGAICMSQVVYDVVKSRLELDADYLGELSLKNISETVAAYNVWPRGMRPADVIEDSTEAVASISITPFNLALKKLSSHPNHRRIKKLLYGTHQAAWENDTSILDGFSLRMLIESLIERNVTIEECRHSLYEIVGTLNRQKEYSHVADIILQSLHGVYVEATGGTARALPYAHPIEMEADTDANAPEENAPEENAEEENSGLLESPLAALYTDVACRLDQGNDPIRMKKLLYCLCYDSWENDNIRIKTFPTMALVKELAGQVTSSEALQNRLKTILLRLNRRAKYSPIANEIFRECQALYPDIDSQISMPGTEEIEESSSENTQINVAKQPSSQRPDQRQNAGSPPVAPYSFAR